MSNNIINATNSNIILNTEGTANISTRFIKRIKTQEEVVVEGAIVESKTDVDDSDGVTVLGHSRSLMHTARKFGLECCRKNFKNMNMLERYYAARPKELGTLKKRNFPIS
ncbi:hypothetical protein BD560DRAFT_447973 [Blakeslea trispora]|nr:hypothetical protein BD560DRAFT_447973 [Blakeslea trispora]